MKDNFLTQQKNIASTLSIALVAAAIYFTNRIIGSHPIDWLDFMLLAAIYIGYSLIWWQKIIRQAERNKVAFYILLISGIVAIGGYYIATYLDSIMGERIILIVSFLNLFVLFYFAGYCMWRLAKKKETALNITQQIIYTMPIWAFPFLVNSCCINA